ncbi:MAG: hypothetical protein GWN79_19850, partial [Actinobacteria bacterium]|nr:hypothetical protein [Actinomycetota bacterium]NIS34480.1 hypothetical protein [Actinomycetota bacterium]NIT97519.1 hypothetical protein [Actinomycetota bacterium]NIU21184.1 hypothetical protein [Actinomycetota bacterium]NIU69250.1 hypothetical protein [Actinomycetota bacterium]
LEYVPPGDGLTDIGGLDNLKAWIDDRADVFNRHSAEAGMPIPRGMLVMGVSGCGKSLSAKAIARLWNVPLFRL